MEITVQLCNFNGYRFPVAMRPNTSDVYTANMIFKSGDYRLEKTWLQFFQNDQFKPRFIIDGGANVGYASVFFANRYPEVEKILAIEPEIENFEILKYNTQYYPQVEPIQSALWKNDHELSVALGDLHKSNDAFMTSEIEENCPPPPRKNSWSHNRKTLPRIGLRLHRHSQTRYRRCGEGDLF